MQADSYIFSFIFQLFEGMKAYRGVDGKIRLFRPNMNMNRMNLSAKRSGLPTFDGDEFINCIKQLVAIDQEWVPHTEAASLYIRPTLIGIDVSLSEWVFAFYLHQTRFQYLICCWFFYVANAGGSFIRFSIIIHNSKSSRWLLQY